MLSEERELRSWLCIGRSEAASSPAEVVRQSVGAPESEFDMPVEVVTVSDVEPGPAGPVLVTTLREVVTNVLRHGNLPTSVYLKVHAEKTEASIKDYGSGFDLDPIPHDRHEVCDSAIGRMEKVGGKAHIRVCSSGTEITLEVSGRAENIPRSAPNIAHDVSNIPYGVPNTQGASWRSDS